MADALKLRAEDEEDLSVVSAMLQDAVVPVADMVFLPAERRFIFVANRFRWERAAAGERPDLERVLAGVRFDAVTAVRKRGFQRGEKTRLLVLLDMRPAPGGIQVEFSGGPLVRIEAERIACRIEDLGEPWPTPWRPAHPD